MLNTILLRYSFPHFIDVSQRYSISEICSKIFCGLYILRFRDQSFYVGQSGDIARRFLQHKRRFNDIEAITFKSSKRINLNSEEEGIIQIMQQHFALRNINLTSLPQISECELDELIFPDDQQTWLKSSYPQISSFKRVEDPRLRSKTIIQCNNLLNIDNFKINFLPIMRKYIRLCIPEPFKTELTFWGCTCLPTYNNLKIIYSRINLRFQEVFTAYHDVPTDTNIMSWHLVKSPFSKKDLNQILQSGDISIDEHQYPSGGVDQFRICAFDLKSALSLLENATFIKACKTFNLARMRSGAQPYSRFHAPALADELLSTL